MRKLFLEKLILSNFQQFSFFEAEFKNESFVVGGNGEGKTTLFSALNFLLFAKDSEGKSDFDINRLVNGCKTDEVDTWVESHFSFFDGE